MTGMMHALLGAGIGLGYRTALLGGTLTGSGDSYVTFNTDGTVSIGSGTGIAAHDWYKPTTASKGTGHYIKATYVSGDALQGGKDYTLSSWTQLNVAQNVGLRSGGGTGRTSVQTIQIATDSGGSNVVCTGTYTFGN